MCCFIVAVIALSDEDKNVTAVTAMVNSDVTLTCAANGSTVRWRLYPGDWPCSVLLFNGRRTKNDFPRFTVSEETGDSELVIRNVQHTDAGQYECLSSTAYYFRLTVIS